MDFAGANQMRASKTKEGVADLVQVRVVIS